MNNESNIRPTPILKGKSAKKFYKDINDGKTSKEQQEYLEECYNYAQEHGSYNDSPKHKVMSYSKCRCCSESDIHYMTGGGILISCRIGCGTIEIKDRCPYND
jgi:hypothetical protein